jgi:hypothetical protein
VPSQEGFGASHRIVEVYLEIYNFSFSMTSNVQIQEVSKSLPSGKEAMIAH